MRKRIRTTMRTLVAVLLLFALSTTPAVHAEGQESQATEAVYDMERGGTQTFVLTDENGTEEIVVIEELPGTGRVANGNYKVSYQSINWTAGFHVRIESNKIATAYMAFHEVGVGTISNGYLMKNSDTKATYGFLYKVAGLTFNTGVIAKISDSKLVVSKK